MKQQPILEFFRAYRLGRGIEEVEGLKLVTSLKDISKGSNLFIAKNTSSL